MSPKVSSRRGVRGGGPWWIAAGAVLSLAAGTAYLFDPKQGRARRSRIMQSSADVARQATSVLHLPARPVRNYVALGG